MEKLFHFTGMLWQTPIIAILANIRIASGQTEKKQQFPIPENINALNYKSSL